MDCLVSIPKWCDYKSLKSVEIKVDVLFQFQNGAIIRVSDSPTINMTLTFQFQNGAFIRNIYSTISGDPYTFQFQNGAIISVAAILVIWENRIVSITKWCDYKTNTNFFGSNAG